MTSAANSLLNRLPVEVTRRIASYLAPQSALNLLLVCRSLYDFCNDWTVWEHIIQYHGGFLSSLSGNTDTDRTYWKRYAIAAVKVNHFEYNVAALKWLPQLMASNHEILNSANVDKLLKLSKTSYYQPGERAFECWMPVSSAFPRQNFPTNPPSIISVETWHKIQVASFCLSTRLISQNAVYDDSSSFKFWSPSTSLLESAPWLDINPAEDEEFPYVPQEQSKWEVILHALANKLVGVLSVRLRLFLAERRTDSEDFFPPTALTIPFSSFMRLPPPFSPDSIDKFNACHLQQMATPEFFEEGTWVGFTVYTGSSFPEEGQSRARTADSIVPFGGDSIVRNQLQNTPEDLGSEKNVKFTLIAWVDEESFVLESNWLQSQTAAHKLKLTIHSSTGIVEAVRGSSVVGIELEERSTAVITPFGLVIGCNSGQWIWLWKCEWSSASWNLDLRP